MTSKARGCGRVMSDLVYYDCPVCGTLYTDEHRYCPGCARQDRPGLGRKRAPLSPRHFLPAAVCLMIGFATSISFLVVEHPRATMLLYVALLAVAILPFIWRR